MQLKIKADNLSIDSKIDLLDNDENLKYYLIYDFAYKRRIQVFNDDKDVLGYVQLIRGNLQEEVRVFDDKDNLVSTFDINKIEGDIKGLCFKVESLIEVDKNGNNCLINIDENNLLKGLMYLVYAIDVIGE